MNDLRLLVEEAKAGDRSAFDRLVQQNQGWVTGCAAALLGDYQLAEDAVQEAFAAAHTSLSTLAEPEAFRGWLKAIVRHTCYRVLRQHRPDLVPLDVAGDVPSGYPDPAWLAEEDERRHEVLSALATLPEEQRQVVLLHYWQEYSHREIASLIGIPVTQVNNRLHSARARLRKEMLTMADQMKQETVRLGETRRLAEIERTGEVVAVHGPVADVRFAFHNLPALRTWLIPADKVATGRPILAVVEYLGDGVARAVETEGVAKLRKGREVVDAGLDVAVPIGDRAAREAMMQIVKLAHRKVPPRAARGSIETGLKALDLFCPLRDGDFLGFRAGLGVGMIVMIQELLYRLATRPGHLSLVAPYPAVSPAAYPEDIPYGIGSVQTIYLPVRNVSEPPEGLYDPIDAVVTLSMDLVRLGMFPAIDPVTTTSRNLDPDVVGAQHVGVATRARELLGLYPPATESTETAGIAEVDRTLVGRARRLRRFLSQPMFVAEPWIRRSGQFVPVADTLRGCEAILDGAYDSLPEEAFYMANTIDEVVQRAGAPGG